MFDDAVWAVNSAVECYPHTVEVRGSNPLPPTITAEHFPPWPFYLKIEVPPKLFLRYKTGSEIPLGAHVRCGCRFRSVRLKVEVGNLWIHRVQSLPKPDRNALAETFGIRWGTYGEIKPEKIPPSGLPGPVQLMPRSQWVATL